MAVAMLLARTGVQFARRVRTGEAHAVPSGRQSTTEEYALLVGPVFARLRCERAEVTGGFIDTVVTQWLVALGPATITANNAAGGKGGPLWNW